MKKFHVHEIAKSPRIDRLKEQLFAQMPELEADRAVLLTESYRQTEDLPMITRRARAFAHLMANIPIVIRDDELVVGANSIKSRSSQVYPEFSYQWVEDELDTMEHREADPFRISEETKTALRQVFPYWKGKTTSELATAYMTPQTVAAIDHNIFTPGNYFYNGIGHVTVDYGKVLRIGLKGIAAEAKAALDRLSVADGDYVTRAAPSCRRSSRALRLRVPMRAGMPVWPRIWPALHRRDPAAGAAGDREKLRACAGAARPLLL